jgi:predicted RNA binding protein YcfA (HicA-like mRNA interferase family)
LKPITGPELCQLLDRAGWKLKRIRGSHYVFTKAGERRTVTVPVHGKKEVKPGLAARIAKDASITW